MSKFILDPSGRVKDRAGNTVLMKDVLDSRDELLSALMAVVAAKPGELIRALEAAFHVIDRAK